MKRRFIAPCNDSGIMASMKNGIDYKDLIDLEYLLSLDKNIDDTAKHKRDRQLFLELQKEAGNTTSTSRSLIRAWIKKRLQQCFITPKQISPGQIFYDLRKFLTTLVFLKGIITGVLTGLIFFSYTGDTPVNVFHFLLFFVFTQLLLVFLLLCSLILRKLLPSYNTPSFYSLLFQTIFNKTVSFFQKQAYKHIDSDTKLNFNHAFSIVKFRSKIYGSLFYWPIFLFFQLLGIGFNLGLLSTTLFKVSTSDVAFGWQSTIQMSSSAIHYMTKLLALPWYYLVPAQGYPTLQEIEGSRIVLKEGIYHLSTLDLVAWWPFLVFCLIFYGLFVRLFFYGFGKIMEHRSLKTIKLDTASCLSLLRRMQTPVVTTQAAPENIQEVVDVVPQNFENDEVREDEGVQLVSQLTLLPDEIFHLCTPEILQPYFQAKGLRVSRIIRFMEGYEEDEQLIKRLGGESWPEQNELTIIMEGWMVPLVDFISYLKRIRQILPPTTLIHLALVGCPDGNNLTAIKYRDLELWQKKIATAGDPYLDVFPLLPEESR